MYQKNGCRHESAIFNEIGWNPCMENIWQTLEEYLSYHGWISLIQSLVLCSCYAMRQQLRDFINLSFLLGWLSFSKTVETFFFRHSQGIFFLLCSSSVCLVYSSYNSWKISKELLLIWRWIMGFCCGPFVSQPFRIRRVWASLCAYNRRFLSIMDSAYSHVSCYTIPCQLIQI